MRLSRISSQTVRARFNELVELIELDDPFRAKRVPDSIQLRFRGLRNEAIIEIAGTVQDDDESYHAQQYRIPERIRDEFERQRETVETAPCGHRGLRNLGDGYTCTADWCHETFPRSVAADMLGVAGDA